VPKKTTPAAGTDGAIPVAQYVNAYEPHVRTLFYEVLKVARSAAPVIEEKAYRGWGVRIITDHGEVALAGYRDHVNVKMRASERLRDPAGILEGTGTSYRHAKIRSVADARSDALCEILRRQLATGPRRLTLREGKGQQILERIRRMCSALPEVSERLSHGTPTFFARGKQFAQIWAAHHDDHGLQMWCAAPTGAQGALVKADPKRFFVPPYVGHRGWLGVRLERPDWPELGRIIADAYAEVGVRAGPGSTRGSRRA
jgi:hypothetical protein